MNSTIWQRSLRQMIASSAICFLAGCATTDGRVKAAARTTAEAGQVGEAIRVASDLPPLPEDCRRHERTGVKRGDRLDVATLKGDQAVGRGNDRIDRCAAWFDDQRKARTSQ